MAIRRLSVQGATAIYPVVIGPDLLENELPAWVDELGVTRAGVITNTTLAPLYGEALAEWLPGGFLIAVPDGEAYKTLATVETIYGELLAAGADRRTVIVALGGGVMGDMAGFAAATFMRGIPFIQAPTSLLAMVDASIGGKVGVDLPQGKNLVGAFKDPLAVFADTATLATLPDVEYRCGLAEVIKGALIGDRALLDGLTGTGALPVEDIIARAAAVKIEIVEEDRLEGGIRAVLNLGHTFGHAIEQVSGYRWKHGEGVAVGMVAAARLSARLGRCDPVWIDRIERLLAAVALPVRFTDLDPEAVWEAMRHDKKWRDGGARFVLLDGDGRPVIADDVPHDAVLAVLHEMREDT